MAKSDRVHQDLRSQIQAKTAVREYWGIVCGSFTANEGTIDLPIGRHPVDRKKWL